MLEPLAVLASLCGAGQEILSLPLHPLQNAVSKEARMHTVEQVMVTAVNQVRPASPCRHTTRLALLKHMLQRNDN